MEDGDAEPSLVDPDGSAAQDLLGLRVGQSRRGRHALASVTRTCQSAGCSRTFDSGMAVSSWFCSAACKDAGGAIPARLAYKDPKGSFSRRIRKMVSGAGSWRSSLV